MSPTFPFLDLPPEIRTRIYLFLLRSPSPIDLTTSSPTPHPTFPHSLLLTSSQLYHEIRPLYFTHNTFAITITRPSTSSAFLAHFLSPAFLDYRQQIYTLQLTLLRWGTKDFFKARLLPALEDCVLNGRLRVLEVRVMKAAKGESFRALERLLGDPYLERARLMVAESFTACEEGYGYQWKEYELVVEDAL